LKRYAAFVDRVDAPAADAIGFGVAGGTEAAEFAAGGGNKLRCRFHCRWRRRGPFVAGMSAFEVRAYSGRFAVAVHAEMKQKCKQGHMEIFSVL
jgi:hypothetical protein